MSCHFNATSRVAEQTVRGYSVLDQQLSALQAVDNSGSVGSHRAKDIVFSVGLCLLYCFLHC